MSSASASRPSPRSTSRPPTSTPTRGSWWPRREAGADFAITQLFFRADDYVALVDRVNALGCDLPIIPGIMPITQLSQIKRFAELSGHHRPAGGRGGVRRRHRACRGAPDRHPARDQALRRAARAWCSRSALLHAEPVERDQADLRRSPRRWPTSAELSSGRLPTCQTRRMDRTSPSSAPAARQPRSGLRHPQPLRRAPRPTMWPSHLRRSRRPSVESASKARDLGGRRPRLRRPPRCRSSRATTSRASRRTGFRAQHGLGIRVRKLDDLGTVINGLVAVGDNQVTIDSVGLGLADTSRLESQAREAAFADARRTGRGAGNATREARWAPVVSVSETASGWVRAARLQARRR